VTQFKSGDLVVLKSGGPAMTVDTVNTDIFDDSKITGVLCVWFVGDKLERVRFDHGAIEPARSKESLPGSKAGHPEEAPGEYTVVLDEMAAALNIPADTGNNGPGKVARKRRIEPAAIQDDASGPAVVDDRAAGQPSAQARPPSRAPAPNRLDAAVPVRPPSRH
jgi:uncharacterized protein YodC (DUF2158 family)